MAGAVVLCAAEARAEDPPPAAATATATGKIAAASPPAAAKSAAKPAPRRRNRSKPPPRTLAPNTPFASYPAFRLLDDGQSRVVVEVSRKVTITEHKAQGRVVYRLDDVALPGHNAHLALPTGFFRTPIDRVGLVEQGKGVDLVIELREAVQPTYRVLDTPRGIVIQVDFPRPSGAEAPPAPTAVKRTGETKRLEPKATTEDD
jgi:hypothetical protein